MIGTIKLYQIGRKGKRDSRVATKYYFDEKDRKAIIKGWVNFYGSHIYNFYIQVAPGIFLRKNIKNG